MNDIPKKKIESSVEIEALLNSFRQIFDANTAILYEYVEEKEIEGTEILQLLSKARVNFNTKFIEADIIKDKVSENKIYSLICNEDIQLGGVKIGIDELIDRYENGTLYDVYEKINLVNIFNDLKKFIKVLRFCTYSDKDPDNSRWKFDYKHRPPKYLVFTPDILKDEYKNDVIPGEGVTAAFCRLCNVTNLKEGNLKNTISPGQKGKAPTEEKPTADKNLFLSLSINEIDDSPAHVKKAVDKNIFKDLGSHQAGWIILNKKDGSQSEKVLGCLRFEFYSNLNRNIDLEERYRGIAKNEIIDLVVNIIENVFNKQKEESYDKLYKCLEPILNEVIRVGVIIRKSKNKNKEENKKEDKKEDLAEWDQLGKVHDLIEHLYYVFKRNTYHGETIIQRVNYFIEDLLDILGLPKDIFGNVWENLRRHEDLMLYSIDNYRDHVMHQFHVFILGYLIIYNDFDYFHNLINKNYEKIISIENEKCNFEKTDIIRIWALASLFHDCGYIFEKLPLGFKKFSNSVLGKELEPQFAWERTLLGNDIMSVLSRITEYNIECEENTFKSQDFFGILMQKAILKNDHGVISAIILLKQESNYPEGYGNVKNIEAIINIASMAIAIHNTPVFKETENRNNQGICLSCNPIAFLLIYCDTVQEWGRINSSVSSKEFTVNQKESPWIIPALKSIEFVKSKDSQNNDPKRTYKVILDYPAEHPGRKPDIIELKSKVEPSLNTLVSQSGWSFEIHYHIRSNKSTSFKRRSFMCGKNNCIHRNSEKKN